MSESNELPKNRIIHTLQVGYKTEEPINFGEPEKSDHFTQDNFNKASNQAKMLYPHNEQLQDIYVKEYMHGKEVLSPEENLLLTRARMQRVIERKIVIPK